MMQPTWADNAIFYHIYPLGLCGAPIANDYESPPCERLRQLREWVPRIKELGCTALYLGPVFESDEHGYDTADYFTTDRRLGTNATLKKFCDYLHEHGIRVVFDGVFNHVGRNFFAFKDLQEKKEASAYIDWFCNVDFSQSSAYGDSFSYEGWYDAYNLVKLNLNNQEVRDHLFAAVTMWIDQFGIDGLRLDVAEIMDKGFLKALAEHCRSRQPGFWVVGEVIKGDYRDWANTAMLDSTTNYELYEALIRSHNDRQYGQLAHTLERQFGHQGVYKDIRLFNFADNHDTSRLATLITEGKLLPNVYTILFTVPGIPAIYYGSEWAVLGLKGTSDDYALRPALSISDEQTTQPLFRHIQTLTRLRTVSHALQHGSFELLFCSDRLIVYQRVTDIETLVVLVNSDEQACSGTVSIPGISLRLQNILTGTLYEVINGQLEIDGIAAQGSLLLTSRQQYYHNLYFHHQ